MTDVYAFSANDKNSEFLIESEIEKQLTSLNGIGWYHGYLERDSAEKKILTNGEFLVRLSKKNDNKFVVSTKWNGKYVHVVIKNGFDLTKKQMHYYIVPKFKFNNIAELVSFHKTEQYPLSNSSEAVLFRPVLVEDNNKKEHLFRKSVRVTHKTHNKMLPRSDSETLISSYQFSNAFQDINKSLTSLPTELAEAPGKPSKPSFRLFSNKLVLPRHRPKNIHIKNDKLFKESGDYSDYIQSRDSSGGLQREKIRRGLSAEVLSPSLFGLNRNQNENGKTGAKLTKNDSGGYLPLERQNKSLYEQMIDNNSDYVAPSQNSSEFHNDSLLQPRRVSAPAFVISRLSITETSNVLSPFINLNLTKKTLLRCGPIEAAFDPLALNKATSFLLSNPNNTITLSFHLLHELRRIFHLSSTDITAYKPGYRSLFLTESSQCLKDFSIRQAVFTKFVKATIANTTSTDRRIQLILFWIRVADNLATKVCDMFHFRSVITAIFSDEISSLNDWKTIYRDYTDIASGMQSLRNAIFDNCFERTDIDQCIPDIVQLYKMFTEDSYNYERFCATSLEVARWTVQSFDDPALWLNKVCEDMDTITTVPFLAELVQTETLLSVIVGKSDVCHAVIDSLMLKARQYIRILCDLRNQTTV